MSETAKPKKHRSPAYPSLRLSAAIRHIETIYKAERRHAAPVSVVAEHCGTDITSSNGLRLIAALKQYGLVVEEGSGEDRTVRLSDRALDILLADGDNSDGRDAAIKAAALAPTVYKKIWDKYGGEIPSKATLKSYLIRDLNFNDAHVDKVIKTFLATIEFASLVEDDKISEENGDDDTDTDNDGEEPPMDDANTKTNAGSGFSKPKPPASQPKGVKDFPLYTSGSHGVLCVPDRLSESDFALIKQQIDAYLKVVEATSVDKALDAKASA